MKNKILLWLDIFSSHYGMSELLQKKHDCDIFAIIDINKGKKFYEEQKIVKFAKKWYIRDCFDRTQKKPDLQYLEQIEKKYKFNIWKIVYSDINFYKYNEYHKFKYDEILTIIEQECRLFEKVIDEVNPNYFIVRITDLSNAQILQKICISKGIKVLMLGFTRFGNRGYISQEYDYLEIENKEISEEERSFEELHENILCITSLQSTFRKKFRNSRRKWITGALKYLSLVNDKKYREYYANTGKTLFKVINVEGTFPLKSRYRKNFIDKNLSRQVKNNEKFIYLPLQLEPERSTLIPATFYTNQLNVITNIAKSLPIDLQLFVKEHPMQKVKGWRKIEFYKKIIELPNVKLFHPTISNEEMLKKCTMTMTIAGTTGLEAALHKKPAIVFADTIYASLPSVYRLKNLEELPNVIREALDTEVKLTDINKFINILERNSFPFNNTELSIKINDEFFYDGYLFDTEIDETKAEEFLRKNHEYFEVLETEYIKKMNQIKNKKIKKNEK